MGEFLFYTVGLIVILFLAVFANLGENKKCLERGGQIIERPSELFDTCLLPINEKP